MDIYFFVIPKEGAYNDILGRLFLAALDALTFLMNLKFKYHEEFGRPIIIKDGLLGAPQIQEMSMKRSTTTFVF